MSATNVNIQRQPYSPKPPRRKGEKKDRTQQQETLKILKEYQTVRDEVEKLDETLGRFYMVRAVLHGFEARGRLSLQSALSGIHGLNRYLKSPPFNKKIEIGKDSSFTDCNMCFKVVLAKAKRMGKGDLLHHPIISDADQKSLYTFMHLRDFSIKCSLTLECSSRRGNENIHSMTKYMFQVDTNENTGRKVVKKVISKHRLNLCQNFKICVTY